MKWPLRNIPIRSLRVTWMGVMVLTCVAVSGLFRAERGVCADAFEENQVKAVFFFNLTKFVSWENDRSIPQKKFTIGIVGEDPFGDFLDKVVADEMVHGKTLVVQRYRDVNNINWQEIGLLFIAKNKMIALDALLQNARKFKVLTVGDIAGFCESGGIVNLLKVGRRIRLQINIEEARKNALLISAQVLKLAQIVETREDKQ